MDAQLHFEALQLVGRLYAALDERDYGAVADCFHPQGEWHRQGERLRSRAEIVTALEKRDTKLVVHHLAGNCVLLPAPDGRVAMRYLLTVFMAQRQVPGDLFAGTPQSGFCDAEMALHEGRWCFTRMQARPPTFKAQVPRNG